MGQSAGVFVCPRGHSSSEADYCSECGAKIQGSAPGSYDGQGSRGPSASGEVCPDCGTVREPGGVVFCEVCGYNFVTGAHGEVPVPAAVEPAVTLPPSPPPPPPPPPLADPGPEPPAVAQADQAPQAALPAQHWSVTISVDPSLRSAESPEAPTDVAAASIALTSPISLIGRRNETRGIFPEVSLDHDEAVSRRHALLQLDPLGALQLRDIGAANGTRLNGKELTAMTDYPLSDGDEITLGHWSRLSVKAS